jgi:hypothetical protein
VFYRETKLGYCETVFVQSAQSVEEGNHVDAVMCHMQGTPQKAAIVRFDSLSMRIGVAGIGSLPSGPEQSGNERRKAGERSVANVVEFYIPSTFRKRVKWTPPGQRGKLIEFYPPAKKSA